MTLAASLYPPMDWQAHQASWPHASHSRFIQLPDQNWHVQIFGHGPALLLLHGTGSSSHSWRDLVLPLAQHHTVICPDLPGHAFSPWQPQQPNSLLQMSRSLNHLLTHLGVWPIAIIGHSAGAAVAAQMIWQHGQTSGTKLIGLNPAWLSLTGWGHWLFRPAAKLIFYNPWSAYWFARHAARPSLVRRLLQDTGSQLDEQAVYYYQQLLQTPSHIKGVLAMMAAWNLEPLKLHLPQISQQVFMLLGENDPITPACKTLQTSRFLPASHICILPGLGHLAHEEAPDLVCQHILQWLPAAASQP